MSSKIGVVFIVLLAISSISAHTWLGCTKMVNGVCEGFIRNYQGRDTGSVSTDIFYTWKALGRPPGFPVCKNDTQQERIYSATYPMATANAGDTLNVMYTPNGHSQPGDHGLLTTSRIHWTGLTTTELVTREDLTDANKIGEWNFGSNCATTGDVASLPCVNGFTIPAGTAPGTYQIVWYWPYDKNQQQVPIGEEYFSCFDVQVLASAVTPVSTSQQANPTSASTQQPQSQSQAPSQSQPQSTTASSSSVCNTMLDDCKNFCGSAIATVCECDPNTGAKTVRCGNDEATSSASTLALIPAMALIAFLAL